MSHHVFSHNEDAKFIKPRRPHNTKYVSLKASSLKEFMGYLLIFFEKYKDVYFKNKRHVCFFWNKKMELCYWESLYNDIAELFFKNPDAKTSKYYELLRCLEVQYNITTDSIALSVRDRNKNTYRDVSELSKKEIGWLLDNEIINYNIVLQKHEEYVRNLKETLIPRDFYYIYEPYAYKSEDLRNQPITKEKYKSICRFDGIRTFEKEEKIAKNGSEFLKFLHYRPEKYKKIGIMRSDGWCGSSNKTMTIRDMLNGVVFEHLETEEVEAFIRQELSEFTSRQAAEEKKELKELNSSLKKIQKEIKAREKNVIALNKVIAECDDNTHNIRYADL